MIKTRVTVPMNDLIIIIITMYIYHALINALNAHLIHIHLNMMSLVSSRNDPQLTDRFIIYYR